MFADPKSPRQTNIHFFRSQHMAASQEIRRLKEKYGMDELDMLEFVRAYNQRRDALALIGYWADKED